MIAAKKMFVYDIIFLIRTSDLREWWNEISNVHTHTAK